MAAIRAGVHAFREQNFVPLEVLGWDTYEARCARYELYTAYANNTAYSSITTQAEELKKQHRLYKNTRGIYNPVARQNQLLISYIYGGSIDVEHMTGGAIPIVSSDTDILDGCRNIFKWSRFGEQKGLYVRYGSLLGDVFLKVCDDPFKKRVRLEVLHPEKIRDVNFDEVGNVKDAIIEYQRKEDEDIVNAMPSRLGTRTGLTDLNYYTYTEKIYKVDEQTIHFETYKDGELFPYYADLNGKPVAEWDESYGFVPLVMANHSNVGLKFGGNAFYNSMRKVDEINDAASLLNDQVRKIVIPLLLAKNVRKKDDIQTAADDPDKFTIIYTTAAESSLEPVIGNIDIEGALKNIQEMERELERDLPELALQRIREQGGDFTAPGIRASYSDAIGRIIDARGNYDHALVRALQMAFTMAGVGRYPGFEKFNLNSYEDGDLDFYIKDRPVVADTLGLSERLNQLGNVSNMPPALQAVALREMDYPDDVIAAVVADTERQTRIAARGLADSIFGNQDTAPDDTQQDDVDQDQEYDAADESAQEAETT